MVDPLIDPKEHRVIDISHTVVPGQNPDRPFAVKRGWLADGTYRDDVLETHTHVGTHVEGGYHFYGGPDDDPDTTTVVDTEDGREIEEYPLDRFYGPGVLFPVSDPEITPAVCKDVLDDRLTPDDIVVVRNDAGAVAGKEDAYGDAGAAPTFTPEAGRWLADRDVKALVLGQVGLGDSVDDSNRFHDHLMSEGVLFVEFVDNLHEISHERFDVMFLPYKATGLGSSFCRAIIIEER